MLCLHNLVALIVRTVPRKLASVEILLRRDKQKLGLA
jgi:hypothetical protein